MHPINYTYEGKLYEAEYDFTGDDHIVVYLPDGIRETWLRGLDAEDAAMTHLKAYAKRQQPK